MNTDTPITLDSWLHNCGLPRLEARMLLQQVLDISHGYIIAHGQQLIGSSDQTRLNQLAQRRLAGEPLAYLLGWREFYSRRFQVTEAVLIPRPETEHLVEAVLAHLPEHGVVWDLGTGSGAIAITVACERPDAQVWAADISAEALAVARTNAAALQADVSFGQGSWYQAQPQPAVNSVDVIVSNPPYIAVHDQHLQQGDLRFEPQHALTDNYNGLTAFQTIITGAANFLRPDGWLLLEHGFDQGEAVRTMLAQNNFSQIHTQPDLAGLERVTLGQRK
ncbi:Methylase of polypeptide chain release factor [Snodgrassella alvi SCGC AB-598-J21]|uniref:Release factor glutamine methyltransferase n=1 Tax=Snodgrassella alvi SCGC AB-598-J21 TaxID=1385367 RepID=A0A074V4Y5_9NEIS|nr:peptide chain release factor N(5)-glutamine methyltransferase [Snodgrassella alvi]KEQ00473.1 Methylase of polypeptide chain release factor [Snodgrassella alvi SCGC AB-598-J21]ORF30514.1 protein-(glutamine-N5) methyltransferase, release factor-specific [Snodgrassella alvi]ORF40089.1 protein-(glutamine-N5) methyltransferase, release factor-specific [Snodgrassella alvi]